MAFSDRLRRAREASNLTQAQVAHRLGISKGSVSAWENGRNRPLLEQFAELCHLYAASADELLREPPVQAAEPRAQYVSGDDARTRDDIEAAMLRAMRTMPDKKRRALLVIVDAIE